ncbi:hypothetical protein Ava_1900 [Trichormus variabilis ATCC 29413]|uniref:Transposase n=1 Tax=Trichormus variabilis (strain ATCC 29413 / PCC 7937) TaxID=240292 RepID=Q3MBW4_TRIV2|nr:hypothetical protein Ava_1900 [Trichormus variabilis ATCC 29413]
MRYFTQFIYIVAHGTKAYPTDLTDRSWEILAKLIPPNKPGGHSYTTDMREICNAMPFIII